MIDIKALEKNEIDAKTKKGFLDSYRESLSHRGADQSQLQQLLDLNTQRKKLITVVETKKAEQNKVSLEVGQRKKAGQNADDLVESMAALREEIKRCEVQADDFDKQVREIAIRIPNKLHHSVPVGKSESDNQIVRTVGTKTVLNFPAKQHFEIGESLGLLDFERATKITGARFAVLKKDLAKLERSLIQFMLDLHTEEFGYEEMLPPFIVNDESLFGTGQLPKFAEDLFKLENFNYYLIPTAEVPVTNYHRDEILAVEDLPRRFAAYTPCFRSEAGSHGRDTRGLVRQHQFNKVELMVFCHPESSYEEHDRLTSNAEEVLKRLELPFRTMSLCSGDIGFGSAKTYDIEVWLPGQNSYREISSCSNFEDFQARRANIRFKSAGGKPQFVHTLNGSGLAVGRTLIAILENYQTEDGKVRIPEALQKYFGGKKLIG